ncbi:MAG: heat-inducible transcriptional repressor HrcA [Myxococcales bacterium]
MSGIADELGNREREVLRAVIREYVATGEPVGSAAIAADIATSSATVRNVMADLEELGYLEKPHTSAGRVPTDRGYRYFVDALVQLKQPSRNERDLIEQRLPQIAGPDELLRETSRLLSSLSHHAAVVTTPALTQSLLRRIEFVKLREGRVLAVLVSDSGLIQNRLLTVDFPVSAEELIRAGNYLSELLSAGTLEAVRERISADLAREQSELDALMRKALSLGQQALGGADRPQKEVHIEGQGSLLEAPEFSDVARIRALFRALEEKTKLLAVLDHTLTAGEIKIFIGTETEFSADTGVSVVAAPYVTEAGVVGCLGVIGPTRMNYSRVISLVDYTARVVSKVLVSA